MSNITNFVLRHPLIVGSIVGFFLGGMIGVGLLSLYIWLNPLDYAGGAYPSELTPNYQDHYLAVIIDSYLVNGNADLALERLKTFDQVAKDKVLDRLAQYQGDSLKSEAMTTLVSQLSQVVASELPPDQGDEANALPKTTTPAIPAAGINLYGILLTLVSIASVSVISILFNRRRFPKIPGRAPKYVIGLDFGTTKSRIVCMRSDQPDGKPPEIEIPTAAIPNEEPPEIIYGEMPTAVIPIDSKTKPDTDETNHKNTETWVIGEDAINVGVENPLFKLAMGDLEKRDSMGDLKNRVLMGDLEKRDLMGDLEKREFCKVTVYSPSPRLKQTLRPEFLAAKLMAELRKKIRKKVDALGETKHVTVTVPFESTYLQREATRFSAKVAGWDNIVTLPEPVAAFLYFQHKNEALEDGDEYFLVFDFGGGTCDISIIRREKKNHLPYVITGSTAEIGGEKIDEFLGRTIGDGKLWDELTPREKFKLRDMLKEWKHEINSPIESPKLISAIDQRTRENKPRDFLLMRGEDLDKASIPFSLWPTDLDRVVEIEVKPKIEKALNRALERAKGIKSKFRINKVFLVGGSSQLWTVRKFVEEYFEKNDTFKKPKILFPKEEELMNTVVYGAALHQYYRSRGKTAIYSTLSKYIYLRYQKDNKVNRDTVWDKVFLGRQGERLPKPDKNLIQIQGIFSRLWHSLQPLRLPSNKPDRKIEWSIYQDNIVTGRTRERIATIKIDKDEYKPGRFTYLRIVYRINQYGDLDLLVPYLTNTQDRIESELLRQKYDFDHQMEEEIREKMKIL